MTEATVEKVPVWEAIRRVMADVGAVGKNRKMEDGQRYAYRGVEDVVAAVHPQMVKHGVVLLPEVTDAAYEMVVSRKGTPMRQATLTVRWHVVGPEGDEAPPVVTMGEALDTSDKATNKAMTAALKYALTQVFMIPVEGSFDDQDADRQERGAAVAWATQDDLDLIAQKAKALPAETKALLSTWKRERGIDFKKLTADQARAALAKIDELAEAPFEEGTDG